MVVRIGDERTVVGKVMEKEEAARAFARAQAEGRSAYMLTVRGVWVCVGRRGILT